MNEMLAEMVKFFEGRGDATEELVQMLARLERAEVLEAAEIEAQLAGIIRREAEFAEAMEQIEIERSEAAVRWEGDLLGESRETHPSYALYLVD